MPILFGNAIDEVIGAHAVDFERMWYYLSRILVMVIVSSVSTWIMSIINNRMTYRTVQDIRAKAIRHIQDCLLYTSTYDSMMMLGAKVQKAVHACMIRLLNLEFVGIRWGQKTFCPQHHSITLREAAASCASLQDMNFQNRKADNT